jgi:hypothetical protein
VQNRRENADLQWSSICKVGDGVARYGSILSGILNDIRYSARSLARTPGLTLALLFTIALGLGSNVTVGGFIQGFTTRNSPVAAKGLAGQSAIKSVADVTPDLAGIFNLSLDGGVVISHRVWQSDFRGEADVSGERVRIGDIDSRVAGVAPDWLEGVYNDRAIDLWRP